MTIFDVIKQHHDRMRQMMNSIEKKDEQYEELLIHLFVHHRLEEAILLKAIVDKGRSKVRDEALESWEEHRYINAMLNDLEYYPGESDRWKIKFEIMHEYVEHHLEEEEEDIFEEAGDLFQPEELERMGQRFQEARDRQIETLLRR